MDLISPIPIRVGYHLHWPESPVSGRNPREAASASREERGMPTDEPFIGQWLIVIECGIEQHLDNSINVAICRAVFANIDAEPAGDGGAHLCLIKMLAFDRARFEHVFSEREER